MTDSRPSDDEFEPYEEDRGIPLPVFWIAIALALWGIVMLYHNNRSVMIGRSERSEAAKPQSRDVGAGGAGIFLARCATCHQPNGSGVAGAVPPLASSPFLKSKPEVVVQILLHGIDGPIRVGDDVFDGHMPSFASVLSDDDLAQVANHVRKGWGASQTISAAFVAGQRARFPDRGAWNGGSEIAATLDPTLPPQPAPRPDGGTGIDPAVAALVQHGSGDAWACASCHGSQGQGRANVPRLAGLPAAYISAQLAAFASESRRDDTMTVVARALSRNQRETVGNYYAGLRTPSTARPSLDGDLERGEILALQGDWKHGVPACFSCHGPSGFGVAPGFPALAAQHPAYTADQLAAWRGKAHRASPNDVMNMVANSLSDSDRRAVADFLATLPPVPAAHREEPVHGRSVAR